MKTCLKVGCNEKQYCKLYCRNHYLLYKKYGKPEYSIPLCKKYKCRIINCEEPYQSKGYCKKHYLNHMIINWKIKLLDVLKSRKCIKCGNNDIRCIQFDHIHDDGYKDKSRKLLGGKFYVYYINRPELARKKLQPLCANCNWIKRWFYVSQYEHL